MNEARFGGSVLVVFASMLLASNALATVIPSEKENVRSLDGTWRFKLEQSKGDDTGEGGRTSFRSTIRKTSSRSTKPTTPKTRVARSEGARQLGNAWLFSGHVQRAGRCFGLLSRRSLTCPNRGTAAS